MCLESWFLTYFNGVLSCFRLERSYSWLLTVGKYTVMTVMFIKLNYIRFVGKIE